MGQNLTQKIIKEHLVAGDMVPGQEIAIRIDQTLTQDATGTMAYLQFQALGIPRVKTKLSVSYIDHNMLQSSFENADDHQYLQSVAAKHGVYFSRPGNGICHQVHFERFTRPGQTLLGSDSHTPTGGGAGMLAIGAGGLDVAVAMGGGPFYLTMPKVVGIHLSGKLQPWVSAKDIILEVLRQLSVKGGVGRIMEYCGEGVQSLTAAQRGTITNMGAELGATTSIFPSDENTRIFFAAQKREDQWVELGPDADAEYDENVEINLDTLEPLIACPHSPDNVKKVTDVAGLPVNQVAIGSCTNSSYQDLMVAAAMLDGKSIHPRVSMVVTPGSKQVFDMIAKNGALATIINAGARILESACGPCIGMGQAPGSNHVSVRSFNRNFEGRSGTTNAQVYLSSPEVAVACALNGEIADPRTLGTFPVIEVPDQYDVNDNMIIAPPDEVSKVDVIMGPNIKPVPVKDPLEETVTGEVLLKVSDNITTDHIMPAGSQVLPLRSNIPKISKFVFYRVDPDFADRAQKGSGGFILGGENYGQGSSREHAALAPMYLGVKAVIVKSFARIHLANLINFGIVPFTLKSADDFDKINQGDELELENIKAKLLEGEPVVARNKTQGIDIELDYNLSERQVKIIIAGGLLNFTKTAA